MNISTSTQFTIASHFTNFTSETTEVTKNFSRKDLVLNALRDAGGESLSLSDISEATGLKEQAVRAQICTLCAASENTRYVWEDETQEDHFTYEASVYDKISAGY